MADQMTTVGIPTDGENGTVKVKTETRSEDAPWGLKDDGTPYKRDPTIYQRRDAGKRRGARAPSSKGAKAKTSPYRDTVLGLVQIVGLPIAAAGTRDDRYLADLVALNTTAPDIADAVDSIAQHNRSVAAALDKLGEVGPYGLLIGALAPLILQVATNHGVVPAGTLGTVEPETLLAAAIAEAEGVAA